MTLITEQDSGKDAGERPRVRDRSHMPAGIVRKKKRIRFRGVPEPLPFSLDGLPDSTLLSDVETAAATRRSRSTLEVWRRNPDHPLRWRRVYGRVMYELPSVRDFLKGNSL